MRIAAASTIDLPAREAWSLLTDWERQGAWMPATTVTAQETGDAGDADGRIEARTGIGPLTFRDPMLVTVWQPPRRCEVWHAGRIVRGPGAFTVEPTGPRQCRVTWQEDLDPPFGRIGRITLKVARPLARLGLWIALRRFNRYATRIRRGGR
ncbi:SRPBCC family protein [Actinobacteria bacterium YIM 96077]|uniref:SRPBCC family protein n=1 Tax=Phytoactinopolyspora halophila TaxID=1981511 RepID=A0A329QRW9_9ACTN|nr:SRPBCC family protein [Phytoactinopolyspora halophila]AYY14304.1 SRPBCC family protein [Actinobacteria bacterium YIM 96077]RAW14846.1 SRPBCC family protein [Phytoactinopolyspora halophila]